MIARGANRDGLRDRLMLAILAVIALVSVMTAVIEFLRLIDHRAEHAAELHNDVTWLLLETDRDLRALHAQADLIASGAEVGRHETLLHHLDDLVHHVGQLNRGTFALDLAADARLSNWAHALTLMTASLSPRVRSLDPASPTYYIEIAAIAEDTAPWPALSSSIMERAIAGSEALRRADALQRLHAKNRLALTALFLVMAFMGICTLLYIQLRKLARTNRHLALLQERSRRNATRARAASTAKSAFLAAMSHEIRTPLNAIIGTAELLALQPLPEGTDRQLCTITAQASLLRDLIDGVLDFSRLDAGQIETRRTETDLTALATLLSGAFGEEARAAGLGFRIDMPAARVMVDGPRLRQILVNLIGNALKFTPHGHVAVRGTLAHPGLLRIEVEDTGIGIPPEDLPRLFREFSRIDASNARSQGGTGLGLAICRRVVVALGGRIGVKSTPDKGSLFWVELPVTLVAHGPAATGTDPVPLRDCIPNSAPPLRILVAEDNAINLEVAEGLLRHMGHTVVVARDGVEAVASAAQERPDLVLMDMQMPLMDGLEAARIIRAAQPSLPIIAVTANAFPEDRRACLAAGMTGFLAKPLNPEALASAIARHSPAPPDGAAPAGPAGPDGPPGPPGPDGPDDLVTELGPAALGHLLDRFESEITGLGAALAAAGGAAARDALLHGVEGAALTLRLHGTAAALRTLRKGPPPAEGAVTALVALAGTEIAAIRQRLDRDPHSAARPPAERSLSPLAH